MHEVYRCGEQFMQLFFDELYPSCVELLVVELLREVIHKYGIIEEILDEAVAQGADMVDPLHVSLFFYGFVVGHGCVTPSLTSSPFDRLSALPAGGG